MLIITTTVKRIEIFKNSFSVKNEIMVELNEVE